MPPPAVEQRVQNLLSEVNRLGKAFGRLPDTIPYYHEVGNYDSTLTAAHDLYDDLVESPELAKVVAWLGAGFGSIKRGLSIPERGLRLRETIEQLEVSVETISEQRHKPESIILAELDVVDEWVQALMATAAAYTAHRDTAPVMQGPSTSVAPPATSSHVPQVHTPDRARVASAAGGHVSHMNMAKQARLDAFPRISRADQARREQELAAERARNREANERAAEARLERKADQRRVDARLRKRKERAKKAAALAVQRAQDDTVLRSQRRSKYFEDSRTAAESTHRKTYKRKGGRSDRARHRSTWARKEYFKFFEQAVRVVGFQSPTDIVNYIKAHDPLSQFQGLRPDVLGKWIRPDENGVRGWKRSFLATVERDGANTISQRTKIIDQYPDIFQPAIDQIAITRATNAMISIDIARAIILAHVRRSDNQRLKGMKFGATFIRDLLRERLNWSYRTTTRAAQKIPDNHEVLGRQMFARIFYDIKMRGVRNPKLVVNPDQAGMGLLPTGKKTWTAKGAKQVDGHGHNEKRQMTLVVASSCDGDFFPFQSVWGGERNDSLPSTKCARRAEADQLGFKHVHGDTRHWSSRDTTIAWVETFLIPYHASVCKEHGYPDDEPMILLLDVWPIHIAKSSPDDFLPWLQRTYPWIHPVFIPGGCTGLYQPADVGLQRIVKHIFKKSAMDWVVGTITRELTSGKSADKVKLPTNLPILRDASVSWMIDAYTYMAANRDLVRQAWANSAIGELNLSWASLTSDAARRNFELQMKDPAFRAEFGSPDIAVPLSDAYETTGDVDEDEDDSALTADELAAAVLHGNLPESAQKNDDGSIELIPSDADDNDDMEDYMAVSSGTEFDDSETMSGTELPLGGTVPTLDRRHSSCDDRSQDGWSSESDDEGQDDVSVLGFPSSDDEPPIRQSAPLYSTGSQDAHTTSPAKVQNQALPTSRAVVNAVAQPTRAKRTAGPPKTFTPDAPRAAPAMQEAPLALALDVAVLGGTNPAALQPPLTAKERRQAAKDARELEKSRAAASSKPGPAKKTAAPSGKKTPGSKKRTAAASTSSAPGRSAASVERGRKPKETVAPQASSSAAATGEPTARPKRQHRPPYWRRVDQALQSSALPELGSESDESDGEGRAESDSDWTGRRNKRCRRK